MAHTDDSVTSLLPNKQRLPRARTWLTIGVFLTCFVTYAVFWSGHHYSIDGVLYFQYAKALLFQHSFQMNPPVLWGTEFSVSKVPVGLSIAYMPVLAILSSTVFFGNNEIRQIPYDPNLPHNPALLSNQFYLFSSFLNPFVTAMTAVVLYLLCRELEFSEKKLSVAALVFGIASPAATYAKFDFAQPLASLFLVLSLLFLTRARKRSPANLVLAGICLGYGILTRPELVIIAAPILSVVAYFIQDATPKNISVHRLRNVTFFCLPVLGFVILNQYVNYQKFGTGLSVGYNPSTEITLSLPAIVTALVGDLLSPGRGILIFFPLSALSVLGIRRLFQSDRLLASMFGGLIICSFLLYATWKDWGGGLSWGPRFFIPLIPILTLLALVGHDSLQQLGKKCQLLVFGLLLLLGFTASFQGLAFNFLGFYGSLHLPQTVIDQGNYNFLPQNSPILMGWNDISNLKMYDIFWLQNIDASHGWALIIFLLAIGFLLFAAKGWLEYFITVKE